jgi:hypothetical protein
MPIFSGRSTTAKRLVGSVVSVAFAIISVETSHAAGVADSFLQYGAARPDGFASTLRLRISFGGGSQTEARSTLALGIGPSWRFESERPNFTSYQYTPSLEAGFTLGGDPILKLGAFDMLQVGPRWRANADATGNSGGVPSWVWWVGGGLIVVALVAALTNSDDDNGCLGYGFCYEYEPPP